MPFGRYLRGIEIVLPVMMMKKKEFELAPRSCLSFVTHLGKVDPTMTT